MKNGVNIAGISEAAHEIREKPQEAQLIYSGLAHWEPSGLLHTRIGTITVGTSRAARDFRIHCASEPRSTHQAFTFSHLTPSEMALIGVGACMLTTIVLGSSSKAHTLLDAAIFLSQAEVNPPWGIEYEISVHGNMETQALLETIREAALRSPNHRTLVESNSLSWSLSDLPLPKALPNDVLVGPRDIAVARETWPAERMHTLISGVHHVAIRWDYGMQLSVWPDFDTSKVGRFPIDQPKQFGGMDRGPNPQEYLLSGLAASVAETAAMLAYAQNIDVQEVICHSQGRVDLHGLLGLDAAIPDKLQDISCTLHFHGKASQEEQAAIAKEAVETAKVSHLLTTAQTIRMSIARSGEKIGELLSAES